MALLAFLVGVLLAGRGALASSSRHGGWPRFARLAGDLAVVDPASFAYVDQPGARTRVELRSPMTGRVVEVLATFGAAFTNNGLAMSNDGQELYVTLIGRRNLRIEQIATATGKRTFIASGWEPAVSPNGRLLSYIEGRATIVVRNLTSGVARRISVAGLLARAETLDEVDPAAWLGDGSELVVMVSSEAVATAARAGPARAVSESPASVIVVHVNTAGRPVRAKRVELPGIGEPFRISGDQTSARSMLVASFGRRAVLARVDLVGERVKVRHLVSLPQVLPLAFDPAGHYFLYVASQPPALWIATIARGRLTRARRLVPNARLGEVSW